MTTDKNKKVLKVIVDKDAAEDLQKFHGLSVEQVFDASVQDLIKNDNPDLEDCKIVVEVSANKKNELTFGSLEDFNKAVQEWINKHKLQQWVKPTEGSLDLEQYMKEIDEINRSKGWEDDRRFPEEIALAHGELSEALEEYRDNHGYDEIYYKTDKQGFQKPEGIAVEIADLIIRVLNTCTKFGIPVVKALKEKKEYNKTRSPKHGGKKL